MHTLLRLKKTLYMLVLDLGQVFYFLLYGILDSLRFDAVFTALKDQEIRNASLNSLGLNLFSYIGALVIYKWLYIPLIIQITTYWANTIDESKFVNQCNAWFILFSNSIFFLFWLIFVYPFSFLVSSRWNNTIASRVTEHRSKSLQNTHTSHKGIINSISDEILYMTRMFAFMFTNSCLDYIPYIGIYTSFLFNCWMASFYSFEAVWKNNNPGQSSSFYLIWLERNWAYFAGFGFTLTVFTMFFSSLTSLTTFSAVFPALIIVAARPEAIAWRKERPKFQVLPHSIRYFEIARHVADWFATKLQKFV